MSTKMTLHRALAELKLIDSKIEKNIQELNSVGISQKGKKVNNYMTVEEFSSYNQSRYDTATNLLERKMAIKSAIVKKNAETQVTIGSKTMSIAEAINYKSLIIYKQSLIGKLRANLNTGRAELNKANDIVNKNLQIILENSLGKDGVKNNPDDVENIRKPFLENNEFSLIDPLKVQDKIDSLQKELDEFNTEVDAALSEINAITEIEL